MFKLDLLIDDWIAASDEFPQTLLKICQLWFRLWLDAMRQEAITSANVKIYYSVTRSNFKVHTHRENMNMLSAKPPG